MPFRCRVQPEFGPRKIIRIRYGFGDQSIICSRFIERTVEQRIVEMPSHNCTAGKARSRGSLHDEWVQTVKGTLSYEIESSTFGCIRIDEVIMLETGLIFGLAQ